MTPDAPPVVPNPEFLWPEREPFADGPENDCDPICTDLPEDPPPAAMDDSSSGSDDEVGEPPVGEPLGENVPIEDSESDWDPTPFPEAALPPASSGARGSTDAATEPPRDSPMMPAATTLRKPRDTTAGTPDLKKPRLHYVCNDVEDHDSLQSRIAVWTVETEVRPQQKLKGGELRLKGCSASEKKLFEAADRAEIASFFEHDAIVVLGRKEEGKLLKQLDPSRAMRARMVRRTKHQGLLDPASGAGFSFKAKSRPSVFGFTDPDDVRTDAPTTSRTGVNTLLSLAACLKLKVFSGDVSSAFLNGLNTGGRDLYFRLPPELAPLIPQLTFPPIPACVHFAGSCRDLRVERCTEIVVVPVGV